MNLIQLDQILITDPLADIIPHRDFVRAPDDFRALVEQLKPLDLVIEISTVDQVRKVIKLTPTKSMDNIVQFAVIWR
jgi:hypothetical protein